MENGTYIYYKTEVNNYFTATIDVKLTNLWEIALDIIPNNARILDLGCGSGRDTLFFSLKEKNVIGLDYSYSLSKLAHQYTNQPIVQADLRNIPFDDTSFDVVWSIGSLLHIKKTEIKSALLEIRRILIHGGRLLTSIKKGIGEETTKDGRFFAYYEIDEWGKILSDTGFFVERIFVSNEERYNKNSNEAIIIPWIFSISTNN